MTARDLSLGIGVTAVCAVVFIGFIIGARGCHSYSTRHWGGTETVEIPQGYVLVNCTWKDSNLWLLLKDEKTGQLVFEERSALGILEGRVKFEMASSR